MFSVAVIGPDGAGKTTVARRLEQSSSLPITYLYMGINIESSNVALPTSRFIEWLKRRRRKSSGAPQPASTSLHHRTNGKRKSAPPVWAGIRLLNRLAEEWYRQYLSWKIRRVGQIVVYDRHFKFDFEQSCANGENLRFTDKVHRWCLAKFYPQPDVVIYLDAPAEVLFARKGEATVEYLEARRQAFLRQGASTRNFIRVDATQSADAVYQEVIAHLARFYQRTRGNGRM